MELNNSTLTKLRAAAKQPGFYRALFTQGATGVSAAQITMEFRALCTLAGIELPKNVLISLDVAQFILAGGVVVNDVQKGAAVLQCVGDIGTGVAAVAQLLGDLGLADPQIADFASLAANGALALSSGGLNVLADLGAVIALINVVGDVGRDLYGSHDAAVAAAKAGLATALRGAINPQYAFAASQAQLYQAGQLNYFDFVANVALQSPVRFRDFFPDLSTYFPSWITTTFVGVGASGGLLETQTDVESKAFVQLVTNKKQVEGVLLRKFIVEPLRSFGNFFNVSPGISLEALSVLSMVCSGGSTGAVKLKRNFDVLTACEILGVTPSLLGDDWVFKGMLKNEPTVRDWKQTLPYPPLTLPQPPAKQDANDVVINGKPYISAQEALFNREREEMSDFQIYLQHLDTQGDIDTLLKIPEGKAILKRWADLSGGRTYARTELGNLLAPLPTDLRFQAMLAPYQNKQDLDFSDYWKCLSVAQKMLESNIMAADADLLSHLGSLPMIQKQAQACYQFILAKGMNRIARQNVANNIGVPIEKLGSRKTAGGHLVFYRKAG